MTAPLVVVTRQADAARPLVDAIERHGMRAWHVPATMTAAPPDVAPLDAAIESLPDADWLVVTSPRAVEASCGREAWRRAWPQAAARVRVAAVGPATARALGDAGVEVHLQAPGGNAADLARALQQDERGLEGKRVIWPRADIADTGWNAAIERAGARVVAPVAYATVDVPVGALRLLHSAIGEGAVDAVTFCSPSSARSVARAFEDRTLGAIAGRVVVAALGKTTAAALERLGAPPEVVSRAPEPAALAEELARRLAVPRGGAR